MCKYNLSLVFLPQDTGGYTVLCPEVDCVSEGETYDEAERNIMELLPIFLRKALENDEGCDTFEGGLAQPGKIFREVCVEA